MEKDFYAVCLDKQNVPMEEKMGKEKRKPIKILHFSDGDLEVYSNSEDETDKPKEEEEVTVNPKNLNWLPWAWYQTTLVSSKMIGGCDYVGEYLADMLGITSPKYQFEINEYNRMKEEEREIDRAVELEEGGWRSGSNNLIQNLSTDYLRHGKDHLYTKVQKDAI